MLHTLRSNISDQASPFGKGKEALGSLALCVNRNERSFDVLRLRQHARDS